MKPDTFRSMRGRILIGAALVAGGLAAGACALLVPGAAASPLAGAPSCPVFPKTNVWNKRVDALPVAGNSNAMIDAIGRGDIVHPDFGSFQGYGIPINVVPGGQKRKHVRFGYADQSDHVGYPIPKHPKIERGSDAHMLIVDRGHCRLYELFAAHRRRTAGTPAREQRGICGRTTCGRRAGRAPTPPGFRSCPGWCAGTR